MKKLITLFGCLTFLTFTPLAYSQTATNNEDKAMSISNVLLERLSARLLSAYIIINDGKVNRFQIHAPIYSKHLEQIDISGCPQDFRMAWLNYVQTWQRVANPRVATENVLDGVGALHGDLSGLNDIARRMEADDTLIPWQKCERVALQYGVDSSNVKLH